MRFDAFEHAGRLLADMVDYGPDLWEAGGHRCHGRTTSTGLELTLLSPAAPTLVYIVEGVDLDAIR